MRIAMSGTVDGTVLDNEHEEPAAIRAGMGLTPLPITNADGMGQVIIDGRSRVL
jgi:hypothetical protein